MWAGSEAEGGPLKSKRLKVRKQVCFRKIYLFTLFSLTHIYTYYAWTETHTHAISSLCGQLACEQNICMHAHTHRCTGIHKLQSKFLQPDDMLLSVWLRGSKTQIKREQRKGREGREGLRSSSILYGWSAGNIQLTQCTLNHQSIYAFSFAFVLNYLK